MEYPGIVFCGGSTPEYKLLIWHEMAHNYFMGALGSNQTDRPFMDEGFTTYWEIRIMDEILGVDNLPLEQWGPWNVVDKDRWHRGLRPYLQWQKSGYALPLHIESDLPDVYMQYRVSAYYKPVCMIFSLQNQVGEVGMRQIMHAYYQKWQFHHPYEEDFLRSCEETLGCSMQWFYDAWFRGTKELDYSIEKHSADKDSTVIQLIRKGDMILPVKFLTSNAYGDSTIYYVPLDNEPTPPGCSIRLPRWDQLRDPNRVYMLSLPGKISQTQLDPEGLLADVNPMNNQTTPQVKFELDYPLEHVSPVDAYRLRWAPTAFYNGIDGLQVGAYVEGDYLDYWKEFQLGFKVGTLTGNPSADLTCDDDLQALGQGNCWGLSGHYGEGQRFGEIHLTHEQRSGLGESATWQGNLSWLIHDVYDRGYLRDPSIWQDGLLSALSIDGRTFPRLGRFSMYWQGEGESSVPFSDFSYSRASTSLGGGCNILSNLDFSVESFLGVATDGTPTQRWFGLGGAGPIDQVKNPWLRAWGSLPLQWQIRSIGDGNLPGYSTSNYLARAVGTFGTRLTLNPNFVNRALKKIRLPSRWQPDFRFFLFGGAGDLNVTLDRLKINNLRKSAGFGINCRFPTHNEIEIAFPIYLSEHLLSERDWRFRTTLSIIL